MGIIVGYSLLFLLAAVITLGAVFGFVVLSVLVWPLLALAAWATWRYPKFAIAVGAWLVACIVAWIVVALA